MPAKAFIDTNILIYLLSADNAKADSAEAVIRAGGTVSVQVLNEFTNVARRKFAMSWIEIDTVLTSIKALCQTEPLTLETHDKGRNIAERYNLSLYDAMIVAAALLAECTILYSEDMHNGLLIDDQLRICDPFKIET